MACSAESDFIAQVMGIAQRMGLKVHWCSDSRKCYGDKGFPDLVIIGRHGIRFAELKMPDGDTSADQDGWAYALHEVGTGPCSSCYEYDRYDTLYELWFPIHLENGTIEKVLDSLR